MCHGYTMTLFRQCGHILGKVMPTQASMKCLSKKNCDLLSDECTADPYQWATEVVSNWASLFCCLVSVALSVVSKSVSSGQGGRSKALVRVGPQVDTGDSRRIRTGGDPPWEGERGVRARTRESSLPLSPRLAEQAGFWQCVSSLVVLSVASDVYPFQITQLLARVKDHQR